MRLLLAAALLMCALADSASAQQPLSGPALERLREETARTLAEYLRIDTSNPPGNELAAARFLQAILEREGIEAQILDTAQLGGGRANLYARLKATAAPARPAGARSAVALVHHMDVVPAAMKDGWTVAPFSGEIRDGYVWGRGAIDMKGHGIVQLMTMIAIKRAGVPLARDLVFIANADEEENGTGAITFVERHPELIADVEFLLTEDGGTRVEDGKVRWFGIGVGEKRPYWLRLVATGTPGHGSVPTADNPVPRIARAVARVAAWETPLRLTPAVARYLAALAGEQRGDAARWLADPAGALRTEAGRAFLLADPNRAALLRNTVTPTMLAGSEKTNSIPGTATAVLDIRLLPDEDTAAFRRELERVIADASVRLEPAAAVLPRFDAPLDTEMYRAIERAGRRLVPGVPVAPQVDVGASDRPTWAAAGITCYGVSPWLLEHREERRGVHGVDERISVENLAFGLRLYDAILRELR
jgi:acetylornithine deacetylase/succinyl-diaminopimelate desuccinylase-like protein